MRIAAAMQCAQCGSQHLVARDQRQHSGKAHLERYAGQDLIRYSVLPWFDFTSISHARNLAAQDSVPKITFGKITEAGGRCTMPVSIHVHHALADGLHVAQFVEQFERYLAAPESL